MRKSFLFVTALCAASVAAVALRGTVRAQGATATAYVAGVESRKGVVPELVVFNTTDFSLTLDLVLRGPDGNELVRRAGAVAVGPRQTVFADLQAELAAAVPPRTRPYEGLFSVELTGDAPFDERGALVHVTQYFGNRKKPKAAFVIRPLFVAGT